MKTELHIGERYHNELLRHFAAARQSISIIMFAWEVPRVGHYKKVMQLNDTLRAAKQRGVSVRCIVHFHKSHSELRRMGIEARKVHIGGLLHTKLVIIDNRTACIGSHNFTERAFSTNAEASVILKELPEENAFTRHFEQLWAVTN